MDKSDHSEFKYLVANESDHRWGITATSVGFQRVDPDEAYPSPIHPRGYYFDVVSGRVLDEYQLIYVVDGEGTLRTESGSDKLSIIISLARAILSRTTPSEGFSLRLRFSASPISRDTAPQSTCW